MISYMINGQGYLLINRDIVTQDIEDFEYTQMEQYPGPFEVINLADEEAVLRKFIEHMKELKPHVVVTYNGDGFDWPYVEIRCRKYQDLNLYKNLGIYNKSENDAAVLGNAEYYGRTMVHLDAFCWVKRDSYLPQGNQGLKAVCREKLGYDPVEIDPEDMLPMAKEQPIEMATYSVSDAVATYYLYTTYVHNFIFSLSTIIPMIPEDVLRKGSGTLCEALLMVEAYRCDVICPNKQVDDLTSFYDGHLLESETYIGGHVECLEAGVFRSDIPNKFSVQPHALQELIDHVDRDLTFAVEIENGLQRTDIANYDDVRQEIIEKLEMLRDKPNREEAPAIYHLDVGAMYPNIILTNRLQPSSIVKESDCAACAYNHASSNCKRNMQWTWRGDYSPADYGEYTSTVERLAYEKIDGTPFNDLSPSEQAKVTKARLKNYSQKVYKKSKITTEEDRTATVCMRENSFYVDTVRAFRDRRYEYKLETKKFKGMKKKAEAAGDAVEEKRCKDKEILMDSLQLAHKCILNSFYGYVMRKGARWRSMEMAGIVTKTGAELITKARELVEKIGRPLELDTDGIWCILPGTFPQNVTLYTNEGKKVIVEYPAAVLNADVHANYTNDQYQNEVKNGSLTTYATHSECSIYFELDGPYKCMVLPASPEEGKLLKKKYVVYNFDGSISELKGFEYKRRGELEIVKHFQKEVFLDSRFLDGSSLSECYQAVGDVANYWLEILKSEGKDVEDNEELLGYISEKKNIKNTVDDYEGRKATSLTTARRLADFLGAEMVKDKGLNCNLIISKYPAGAPVTDRALPVAIFSEKDESRKDFYLKKWCKDKTIDTTDFRKLVDWDYYIDRLGKTIQKIITIPAGMQNIDNPCPSVIHPDWLTRNMAEMREGRKQMKLTSMFSRISMKSGQSDSSGLVGPKLIGDSDKSGNINSTSTDSNSKSKFGNSFFQLVSPARKKREGTTPGSVERSNVRKRVLFADQSPSRSPSRSRASQDENPSSPSRRAQDILEGNSSPETPSQQLADSLQVLTMRDRKPDSEAELQSWLAARKAQWSESRKARKALEKERIRGYRSGASMAEAHTPKKPKSVQDMVKSASTNTALGYWQIIEMQETDSPGEFVIWAMTNKRQLQRLKVVVPRTIYVNVVQNDYAEKAAKLLGGTSIQRTLPHSKPVGKLFEVQFSETKFQRNEKAVANFLTDPNVEGVYESKVPLSFRACIQLGCVTKVHRIYDPKNPLKHTSMQAKDKYKISELDFVNVKAHPYLETGSAIFRKVFLYSCEDKLNNRGIGAIGLFIVDGTNDEEEQRNESSNEGEAPLSAQAYVWIVNAKGMQVSRPPMMSLYRKFQSDINATVTFNTFSERSMSRAFSRCDARLQQYLQKKQGPTIAVCQGLFDTRGWRRAVPALQTLPVATIVSNSIDNTFPAISWQIFAAERMIQRYLLFPRWFADRIKAARYSHLPVCNIGADALTSMIDVLYARTLKENRHLLWASPNNYPDLGGTELDLANMWRDSLTEPKINTQGAYRAISVEIDVFGLPICAIMSSGLLHTHELSESDTSMDSNGDGAATMAVFSDSSCVRAFHCLKGLVTKWIDDINTRGDVISDEILTALYRYLCGFGDALLHDPSLHRLVYSLMTKLFRYFIGEFQRLGAQIVYADFTRVVLHTNKYTKESAQEYVEFLISTISNKDLFNYLTLTPKAHYEQLIWYGPENYGALDLNDEEEEVVEEGVTVDAAAVDDIEEVKVMEMEKEELGDAHEDIATANTTAEDVDISISSPATPDRSSAVLDKEGSVDRLVASTATSAATSPVLTENTTATTEASAKMDLEDGEHSHESTTRLREALSALDENTLKHPNQHVNRKFGKASGTTSVGSIPQGPLHSFFISRPKETENGSSKYTTYDDEVEEYDHDDLGDDNSVDGNKDDSDISVDGEDRGDLDWLYGTTTDRDSHEQKANEQTFTESRLEASGYGYDDYTGTYYQPEEIIDPNLQSHWNLVTKLHPAAIEHFKYFISEMMYVYKKKFSYYNVRKDAYLAYTKSRGDMSTEALAAYQEAKEKMLKKTKEDAEAAERHKEEAMMGLDGDGVLLEDGVPQAPFVETEEGDDVSRLDSEMSGVEEEDLDTEYVYNPNKPYHGPTTDLEVQERVNRCMCELIAQEFADKMLRQVDMLMEIMSHSRLDSTHSSSKQSILGHQIAVDFVNVTCEVLALDESISEEVSSLKRTLLAHLKVREYSEEARYKDSTSSYILRDVICSFCSSYRDIDLLRDENVTGELDSRWLCHHCDNHLDTIEIENRLLNEVENTMSSFLIQDARCARTHMVSTLLCSATSNISAPLEMDITRESQDRKLRTLLEVSKVHNFSLLQETLYGVM